MAKALVLVDLQNDFITGSLGSQAAQSIVPKVVELIESWDGPIVATEDTHSSDYLATFEGKNLPVEHCIKKSDGWKIEKSIADAIRKQAKKNKESWLGFVEKITFGSFDLLNRLKSVKDLEEILICGLCTDICVISNAMILRAGFPNTPIKIVESCCAGATEEGHKAALVAMRACQMEVI